MKGGGNREEEWVPKSNGLLYPKGRRACSVDATGTRGGGGGGNGERMGRGLGLVSSVRRLGRGTGRGESGVQDRVRGGEEGTRVGLGWVWCLLSAGWGGARGGGRRATGRGEKFKGSGGERKGRTGRGERGESFG
ncbi:hypothetical protein CIPAW_08G144800 [Carya illinoinensis]|uniref:Uncharacterized protein n=1 Tax=Carya illinoinensis TaxID=32201 RepID=A0A8T1PRQ1_CARIL|nr:hypothetical protein CIPAW_08G144800 [Carya illinoinensis]